MHPSHWLRATLGGYTSRYLQLYRAAPLAWGSHSRKSEQEGKPRKVGRGPLKRSGESGGSEGDTSGLLHREEQRSRAGAGSMVVPVFLPHQSQAASGPEPWLLWGLRGRHQAQSLICLCRTVTPPVIKEPVRRACLGWPPEHGSRWVALAASTVSLGRPQGAGVRKEGEAVAVGSHVHPLIHPRHPAPATSSLSPAWLCRPSHSHGQRPESWPCSVPQGDSSLGIRANTGEHFRLGPAGSVKAPALPGKLPRPRGFQQKQQGHLLG